MRPPTVVGGRSALRLTAVLLILIVGRYDPVPWWGVLTRATGGISLLLVAAAMTLLCLPRSRAYFRKPPPPPLRYPVGFRPPYAPY